MPDIVEVYAYKVSNFNSIQLSKEILIRCKFENAQYFKSYSFWLFLSVCEDTSLFLHSLFCKCTVALKPWKLVLVFCYNDKYTLIQISSQALKFLWYKLTRKNQCLTMKSWGLLSVLFLQYYWLCKLLKMIYLLLDLAPSTYLSSSLLDFLC